MRAPLDGVDLHARLQSCLTGFLETQAGLFGDGALDLAPILEALTSLTSGGKRLRPTFCYWAFRGAGGADSAEIVTAAAALELLHACAIIHDDVMDRSERRRGQPAAHRRFTTLHRDAGWLGDAELFGTGAAILLGDLSLSWCDQLLASSGMSVEALARARPIFDTMRSQLVAGQYLDLVEQATGGGSVQRSLRVIRYKTVKYTVEGPLHLGAALAGAGKSVLAAFSAYGVPLGEAFQLRDDVLGVFGNPAEMGKPAGDDLREGKRTVLVALAIERGDPEQRALLDRSLGDPHLDDAAVADLRQLLIDTGALSDVEELIAQRTAESLAALELAPVTAAARLVLEQLAVAATTRRS